MKYLKANIRINSLEIARFAEKQHKNVMRDIRNMEKYRGWRTSSGNYFDSKNRKREMLFLTDKDSLSLIEMYQRSDDELRAKVFLIASKMSKPIDDNHIFTSFGVNFGHKSKEAMKGLQLTGTYAEYPLYNPRIIFLGIDWPNDYMQSLWYYLRETKPRKFISDRELSVITSKIILLNEVKEFISMGHFPSFDYYSDVHFRLINDKWMISEDVGYSFIIFYLSSISAFHVSSDELFIEVVDSKPKRYLSGTLLHKFRNFITDNPDSIFSKDKISDSKTYIAYDASSNNYKIGRSIHPKKRLKTIKSSNPSISKMWVHDDDIELGLHHEFSHKKVESEWFGLDESDLDSIFKRYKFKVLFE